MMLKGGRRPVCQSIFSLTFLLVFLFLLTKLLLQAYLHSLPITAAMVGTLVLNFEDSDPTLFDLWNTYFRGLCLAPKDGSQFCMHPPLQLKTATRTIPLFMLITLYLPSTLYIITLHFKRRKPFTVSTMISMISALVTNLSFFADPWKPGTKNKSMPAPRKRCKSLPNISTNHRSTALYNEKAITEILVCQVTGTKKRNKKKSLMPILTSPLEAGTTMKKTMKAMLVPLKTANSVANMTEMKKTDEMLTTLDNEKVTKDILLVKTPKPNNLKQNKTPTGTVSNQRRTKKTRRSSLPLDLEKVNVNRPEQIDEDLNFSWKQSSVLYGMFLYAALTVGGSDVIFQLLMNDGYQLCKKSPCSNPSNIDGPKSLFTRILEVDTINQIYVLVLTLNIALWITLTVRLRKQRMHVS